MERKFEMFLSSSSSSQAAISSWDLQSRSFAAEAMVINMEQTIFAISNLIHSIVVDFTSVVAAHLLPKMNFGKEDVSGSPVFLLADDGGNFGLCNRSKQIHVKMGRVVVEASVHFRAHSSITL